MIEVILNIFNDIILLAYPKYWFLILNKKTDIYIMLIQHDEPKVVTFYLMSIILD